MSVAWMRVIAALDVQLELGIIICSLAVDEFLVKFNKKGTMCHWASRTYFTYRSSREKVYISSDS